MTVNDANTATTECSANSLLLGDHSSSTPSAETGAWWWCNHHHQNRSSSLDHGVPALFPLFRNADWKKLRSKLKDSEHCYSICQDTDDTKLSCLTLALVTPAPMDIMQRMLEIDPELPYNQDVYGATPLHLACLNGSSIEKIKAILAHKDQSTYFLPGSSSSSTNTSSISRENLASIVDKDRRSALHHAVEFTCNQSLLFYEKRTTPPNPLFSWLERAGSNKSQSLSRIIYPTFKVMRDYCLQLVEVLCEVAPEMIFKKCIKGLTPIDILHIHKIRLYKKAQSEDIEENQFLREIYGILKQTSIQQYKKQKLQWETGGSSITSD